MKSFGITLVLFLAFNAYSQDEPSAPEVTGDEIGKAAVQALNTGNYTGFAGCWITMRLFQQHILGKPLEELDQEKADSFTRHMNMVDTAIKETWDTLQKLKEDNSDEGAGFTFVSSSVKDVVERTIDGKKLPPMAGEIFVTLRIGTKEVVLPLDDLYLIHGMWYSCDRPRALVIDGERQ